ncbi:MAG: hypothetical protein K0B01_11060 [Syntrophobacterales bacterium]|nr:hypothetical protein [Syntrophobacterales bacterium]
MVRLPGASKEALQKARDFALPAVEVYNKSAITFALQLYPSAENLAEAVRCKRDVKAAAEFVEQYSSSMATEVFQSRPKSSIVSITSATMTMATQTNG